MARAGGVTQTMKNKKVGKKQHGEKNNAKVAEPGEAALGKGLGLHGIGEEVEP